ncbi:phage tail protein [Edwardsiella tarda]|uniref:phage tail protein n=1 Tax=Edwardsiella tarda TaxID=636 RepID=UPI003A861846
MKLTDIPAKQAVPFGVNGQREALLPTTPAGDNKASYNNGFPPVTMILKSAGGVPPKGQDMNQILFELSSLCRWFSAGGPIKFDADFCTKIGGYPAGSYVMGSDNKTMYRSTQDDNINDPNSSLVGWVTVASDILSGAILQGLAGSISEDSIPYNYPSGLYSSSRAGGFEELIFHLFGGTGSTRALELKAKYSNASLSFRTSRDAYGFEDPWTEIMTFPVGAPIPWPSDIILPGYMKMNGSPFDTSAFPALYAAYPSGVLPDMRGEAIRGVDDGRGVDPGRTVLSWQDGSYMVRDVSSDPNVVWLPNATLSDLNWDKPAETNINMQLPYSTRYKYVSGFDKLSYFGVSRMRNVAFHWIVRAA